MQINDAIAAAVSTEPDTAYGVLEGAGTGKFFTTPDSAAGSQPGPFEIVVHAAVNWTNPAGSASLYSQWNETTGQRSFLLGLLGNHFWFNWMTHQGVQQISHESSVPHGWADFQDKWVKAKFTPNIVPDSHEVIFETSVDGVNWVLNDTVVMGPFTTTGVCNSGAKSQIMGHSELASSLTGKVFEAYLTSSIGGPVVQDFDVSDYIAGNDWDAPTGEIWTRNGGIAIVRPAGERNQIDDKLLRYFKANGATSNDLDDAEWEFVKARILNGAILQIPTEEGIFYPTIGALTPTFTRASFRTIRDHNGTLRTLKLNEPGCHGLRRVENKINIHSENATNNAAWTDTRCTAVADGTAPNDSGIGYKVTEDVSVTNTHQLGHSAAAHGFPGYVPLKRYLGGMLIKHGSPGRTIEVGCYDGAVTHFVVVDLSGSEPKEKSRNLINEWYYAPDKDGWWWVWIDFTASVNANAATANCTMLMGDSTGNIVYTGDGVSFVRWAAAMVESISGQFTTMPSEYLSVGVLAPPYPQLVDGVRYYPYRNGTYASNRRVERKQGPRIARNIRLGYFPDVGTSNVVLYSEQIDNAAGWMNLGAPVVTPNIAIAPDGSVASDRIDDQSNVAFRCRRSQNIAIANDLGVWVVSVHINKNYANKSNRAGLALNLSGGATPLTCGVALDTITGVATALTSGYTVALGAITAPLAIHKEEFPDHWRIGVSLGNNNSGNIVLNVDVLPAVADSDTGAWSTGSMGYNDFWGVQGEQKGAPTSYMRAEGGPAGRSQDILTYTGLADVGPLGSMYCEATPIYEPYATGQFITPMSLNGGNNNENIRFQRNEIGETPCTLVIIDGGVSQGSIFVDPGWTQGKTTNMMGRWKPNDFQIAVNGTLSGTDPGSTSPTIDRLSIINGGNTNPFGAPVRAFHVFNIDVTAPVMKGLTANGFPGNQMNDLWDFYLRVYKGFTGSLDDMKYKYWKDGPRP